ncbi:Trk system potassium transporter TrkA [Hespellia stercorisuis]|uniref:Trk system potassium uptake protein TrkA n=1 Tax=Hespellia stercorisuis DSM 15480 TaxID=1121950 RepID=A0A1M6PGX8_9FIRM|nr:Trk system potassium transporter TrkA [Hespellia stercorisuis]SHK07208.1 trk system potassium uptake protein TrkA [Hespellia stercorisuis DSM 15480]
MRIIIVGCGKVGRTIAEQLSEENHDIAVIDPNGVAIHDVTNNFDVMGVVGNGASYNVQMEAGIENADILVAVTGSDELNLLCCLIAKKAGDCSTIARVRNPMYNKEINFIKEELGLSMTINPEFAAATEISRVLRFPSAIKIDTFAKGKVELLEFIINEDSMLHDISVADVTKKVKSDVLICAVKRGDEVVIPNGSFMLKENDVVSIVASPLNSGSFFRQIGVQTHQVHNAMIVGGGTIAYYLSEILLAMGIDVTIIEKDRERCEQLSELLPNAVIINGDATNQDILIEEGIEHCESFVSLTGIDEGNIFLSLFARNRSKAKIVTKINRISFDDIIHTFNLGSLICPKFITAEYIVRYVRAMQNTIGSNVETLYRIADSDAEALEFKIRENTPLVGIPLEELSLKDHLLIACVSRNRKIIIPNGKTQIAVGDTVIVVTTQKGLQDIKDILKK